MSSKINLISVTIVNHNNKGYSTTIRFDNENFDFIYSSNNHDAAYVKAEKYIKKILAEYN